MNPSLLMRREAPIPRENLVGWYRSDTGVNISSGSVTGWRDISGNGNHLTQGTVSKQPTYLASDPLFNNKPCVVFDGVNDSLNNTGLNVPVGWTALAVCTWDFDDATGPYLVGSNVAPAAGIRHQGSRPTVAPPPKNMTVVPPATGTPCWFLGAQGDDTRGRFVTNGADPASNDLAAGVDGFQGVCVGSYLNGSFAWLGGICEVMIFDTQLDRRYDIAIQRYLARRYGLAANEMTFDFNGSTLLDGGNIHTYDRTDAFTVSAWINSDFGGYICNSFQASNRGWGYFVNVDGTIRLIAGPTSGTPYFQADTDTGISAGWNHVAMVKAATGCRSTDYQVYINGSAVTHTPNNDNYNTGSMQNGTNIFRAGGRVGLGGTGRFKKLALYPAELSAGEVQEIYSWGRDSLYRDNIPPDSWYALDNVSEISEFLDYGPSELDLSLGSGAKVYSPA